LSLHLLRSLVLQARLLLLLQALLLLLLSLIDIFHTSQFNGQHGKYRYVSVIKP
jgi:hypothetical protein